MPPKKKPTPKTSSPTRKTDAVAAPVSEPAVGSLPVHRQFPRPQSSLELTTDTTLNFMIRAIYQYLSQFGFEEVAQCKREKREENIDCVDAFSILNQLSTLFQCLVLRLSMSVLKADFGGRFHPNPVSSDRNNSCFMRGDYAFCSILNPLASVWNFAF